MSNERETALRHLLEAEQHIAIGTENIARQREIIAELKHGGHDTSEAISLLRRFEDALSSHMAGCMALIKDLDDDAGEDRNGEAGGAEGTN